MRRVDDVVLNPQILDEKFDWIVVICLDASNFCGRDNDDGRSFLSKKFRNRRFIREIKMRALASQQVGKCSRFEPAHQRAADHPAMSSDENPVRFIHELH